jgi:hypothetical protein
MKKVAGLVVLTLCSYTAFAQERPSPEKMDAVHTCITEAGVEMPAPEKGQGKPPKLTDEQKQVVDNCFKENGVEPPPMPRMQE